MNTSEAGLKANVTPATIRAWARYGAIAATKTSGRWNIDTDSLGHRITLSAKPRTPRPLTAATILALGGSRWTKNGMDRIYLNDWTAYAGIEVNRYGTGNISGAWIDGKTVANGRIAAILGAISKVYFDTADSSLHVKHYGADSIDVRYLNGQRENLNLVQLIFNGINAAAAAL